jgi:hypothetical protein
MTLLEGPFLLIGILAWVAAVVLGVGSWFGMWHWRDRWALTGGLAGLGVFELYLYAHSGFLPVLVPTANSVVLATAGLFVGCGISLAYGTLFAPRHVARPRLIEGSAEETLWLLDAVDRLRPEPLDWALTIGLLTPSLGMIYLGLKIVGGPALAIVGAASLLGPLTAAAGLLIGARAARSFGLELADRDCTELADREAPEGAGRDTAGLLPGSGRTHA